MGKDSHRFCGITSKNALTECKILQPETQLESRQKWFHVVKTRNKVQRDFMNFWHHFFKHSGKKIFVILKDKKNHFNICRTSFRSLRKIKIQFEISFVAKCKKKTYWAVVDVNFGSAFIFSYSIPELQKYRFAQLRSITIERPARLDVKGCKQKCFMKDFENEILKDCLL